MTDDVPLARRDVIAGRLAQRQPVVSAALAVEFNVSEDAIRRDLRALAAEGLCRRVYGGALPITPALTPMAARVNEGRERKEALARAAAPLIRPKEFIFLDAGSTHIALAGFLPDDYDLTVATNSIDVAAALLHRSDMQLIMVGGAVNPVIGGCVDSDAVLSLLRMNIDRCFVGACAVSAATGVSAFDSHDAAFKRALVSVSRHSVVLATNDKLDARAPHRVASVDEIEQFVIECDAPLCSLESLEQAGAPILRAERPS